MCKFYSKLKIDEAESYERGLLNPSCPNPGRGEKINLNFYFHTFLKNKIWKNLHEEVQRQSVCESQYAKFSKQFTRLPRYIFSALPNMYDGAFAK